MKKIFLFIFCFLFGILNVYAKEIDIYFYPNGGSVKTAGFELGSYGYLNYNGNFYSTYTDKDTIKNINSIAGKKFTLSKSGTSLVKGREWYFQNSYDGNIYFFSESKTYEIKDVLNKIGYYDDFISIDLYANWNDKKVTNGTDIAGTAGTKTLKSIKISSTKTEIEVNQTTALSVKYSPEDAKQETITFKTSNSKIAAVDSNGKVTGKKAGTVTITATTSSGKKSTLKIKVKEKEVHYVRIQYDINGGELSPTRDSNIKVSSGLLHKGKSVLTTKKLPGEMHDLVNYNNYRYVNIMKSGYYVELGSEWNTKKDGTGKSYSQSKKYKFSDFCNASNKDCTVRLYVNWKKLTFNRVKELSVPSSIAKDTGYNAAQSIVYTGKYFIIVITNPERKTGLYIMKKNSSGSWVHYKTILGLEYDHGQDVTYIPKNNEIAFLFGKTVAFIDADSFVEKYRVSISRNYSSLAYDRVNDIYYFGYGNNAEHKNYYTICNSIISAQTCAKKVFASGHYMTGQGSEVNNGYLYKLNYDAGHPSKYSDVTPLGRRGGEIDIYDSNHKHYNLIRFTADNGNKGTKNDLGELEGIDFIGNQPYVLFNGTRDGAFGRVYKVSYAKK